MKNIFNFSFLGRIPVLAIALLMTQLAQADWQTLYSPSGSDSYQGIQHAGSSEDVWIIGDDGTVLVSTNGFADTLYVHNRSTQSNDLFDLYFESVDTDKGWIVGANGTILATTDGWNFSPQTSGTTKPITSVDFVPGGSSIGWVVAFDSTNSDLHYTVDGGANWYELGGTFPPLYAVEVMDADNRCFVGLNGSIMTINTGVAHIRNSGTNLNLFDVKFRSSSVGWAVGAVGTILKTTDGGATWTPKSSGTPHDLYSIDYSSQFPNILLACGSGGTIVKSLDGGENWFPTPNSAGGFRVRSVSFKGFTATAHVVTEGLGALRTTTQGGNYPGISVTQSGTPYTDVLGIYDFGSAPIGSVIDRVFTVKNTGSANLIVGGHGTTGNLQFSMPDRLAPVGVGATLTPGESRNVTIRFRPFTEGAVSSSSFSFDSNAPGDWSRFSVQLAGTAAPGPVITVTQGAVGSIGDGGNYAFGNQATGGGASRQFQITNTGQGTLSGLTLTRHGANLGDFSFTNPTSTSLGPSQSATFTVTFNPSALGNRTGEIRIDSNISNFPINPNPFNIFVSGNGINAPAAPTVTAKRRYRTKKKRITIRGTAFDINADLATITARNGRRRSRVRWLNTGGSNYRWSSKVRLRKKRSNIRVQAVDATALSSAARRVTILRKGS